MAKSFIRTNTPSSSVQAQNPALSGTSQPYTSKAINQNPFDCQKLLSLSFTLTKQSNKIPFDLRIRRISFSALATLLIIQKINLLPCICNI